MATGACVDTPAASGATGITCCCADSGVAGPALADPWTSILVMLSRVGVVDCRRGRDGVTNAVSDFTPPIPVATATVTGDMAVQISNAPNFSLSCCIDGLQLGWATIGSFYSAGSSHLTGRLVFHMLLRTMLMPKGTKGPSASTSFSMFCRPSGFLAPGRGYFSHSLLHWLATALNSCLSV